MNRKRRINEWYKEGLHFACQRCGKCCSGPPGIVEITEEEARAQAECLGLEYEQFLLEFTMESDNGLCLAERESEYGFDCVMLDRDPKSGLASCIIHTCRPLQCRTWPFWPETLRRPKTWEEAAHRCPGIGAGPLHSLEEIRVNRDS